MQKDDDKAGAPERPLIVTVKGAAGVAIARAMLAAFRPRSQKGETGGRNG